MKYIKSISALLFISFVCLSVCAMEKKSSEPENYRKAMRDFVCTISKTARAKNPGFIVITQNGQNVAWDNDDDDDKKVDVNFLSQ